MTHSALISWIGETDLRAAEGRLSSGVGPIASALDERSFEHVVFLSNYPKERTDCFVSWCRSRYGQVPQSHDVMLASPMDFGGIHKAVVSVVDAFLEEHPDTTLTFHISPGTSAMAAVWLILGKTRYSAQVIQSYFDRESGETDVNVVDFPFELSAEFVGDLFRQADEALIRSSQGLPVVNAAFEDIVYQCEPMHRVVARAQRVAERSVPVLIQGESGTGKELFARAIWKSSKRRDEPFVVVNCGAIPKELVESEFFGHTKGAFTGAVNARLGAFRAAHKGTLFLDEVGELPSEQQVKLLRVIQESEVRPVGSHKTHKVDVRLICATNRNLYDEVYGGGFREDLFHRIAVAILELPPLREREGDLTLLMDALLGELNAQHVAETKGMARQLSPGARQVFLEHSWPGNIRELRNTLLRALLWSEDTTIDAHEARESILRRPPEHVGVLEHDLGEGFNLQHLADEVRRHYILRALKKTGGNKTKAGILLGGVSQQTLSNWMARLELSM